MIRHDRPWDEAVREMLTAVGDTTVRPAGNFWHPAIDFMLKTFEVEKATPTITRLFLGKRLGCAQCHNHPLENLTQDDFYGMAAFLARTKVKHGYGQYRRIWYDTHTGELEHPSRSNPCRRSSSKEKLRGFPATSPAAKCSPTGLRAASKCSSRAQRSTASGRNISASASSNRSTISGQPICRLTRRCWTGWPSISSTADSVSKRCTG